MVELIFEKSVLSIQVLFNRESPGFEKFMNHMSSYSMSQSVVFPLRLGLRLALGLKLMVFFFLRLNIFISYRAKLLVADWLTREGFFL